MPDSAPDVVQITTSTHPAIWATVTGSSAQDKPFVIRLDNPSSYNLLGERERGILIALLEYSITVLEQ